MKERGKITEWDVYSKSKIDPEFEYEQFMSVG